MLQWDIRRTLKHYKNGQFVLGGKANHKWVEQEMFWQRQWYCQNILKEIVPDAKFAM